MSWFLYWKNIYEPKKKIKSEIPIQSVSGWHWMGILFAFLFKLTNLWPGFFEPVQGIACIGRAGWRKLMCLDAIYRVNIFTVQLVRLAAIRIDCLDVSSVQYFGQIIWDHIADARIGRALDLTALDHIPHGNMMLKEHCFLFFYRLRHLTSQNPCKHFPEPVLLMSVKKLLLPGLHWRKTPKYQYPWVFVVYRVYCMFHNFFILFSSVSPSTACCPFSLDTTCPNNHISFIHHMLLFICNAPTLRCKSQDFNTSHVTLYHLCGAWKHGECRCFNTSHVTLYLPMPQLHFHHHFVSIHLMLLFIKLASGCYTIIDVFQYISCYSLSAHLSFKVETRYVSIHLMLLFI